jgi:predicted membrane-bound spermidine synthase
MYQPYPTSGQPQEPVRMEPPSSVLNAVRLMYVGAALSALEIVLSLVTIGSLKDAIRTASPTFTTDQLHAAEAVAIGSVIVGGLIGIGLWLWMAWANRKGRNWARIVSTVLFGINTLGVFFSLARPHASISLIFTILVWLVGLGAIVLIWNKQSAPYYQQSN